MTANFFDWLTPAQQAAAKARTLADDLTTLFDQALAEVNVAGGELFLPAGQYVGTVRLTRHLAIYRVALVGEYGGTFIKAPSPGAFAIVLDPLQFTEQPLSIPLIRNISMVGEGMDRCGIYAPRRVTLENVGAYRCALGLVSANNYYGHYENVQFRDCDVGMLLDTIAGPITGVRNQAGEEITITLPFLPGNLEGHSGNKLVTQLRIGNCRFGVVMGPTKDVPRMTFMKPTIEGCKVGLACLSGRADIHGGWFESNGTNFGHSEGAETLNGVEMPTGALYAAARSTTELYRQHGPTIAVYGDTKLGRSHAGDGGTILVDDGELASPYLPITQDVGGCVRVRRLKADCRSLPLPIDEPVVMGSDGRPFDCFVRPKVLRTSFRPHGGHVLIADDLTGAGFVSTRIKLRNPPTNDFAWSVEDGIFDDKGCLQINATTGGVGFDFSPVIQLYQTSKYYVWVMGLKPSIPLGFNFPGFDAKSFGNCANGPLFAPAGKWSVLAKVAHWTTTKRDGWLTMTFTAAEAAFSTLVSGIQMIGFDNREDAARFLSEPYFYAEED